MSITLQWDEVDPSIIVCQFRGRWSWEELRLRAREGNEWIRQAAPQRIDGIADCSDSSPIPASALPAVQHILQTGWGIENAGIIIIVSTSKLTQLLYLTFCNFYPAYARKLGLALTIEAARQRIYAIRDSHPSTPGSAVDSVST